MTMTNNEAELRAAILTEFKQVHKLAPADYTENCTNVVMSLISDHTRKARIDELEQLNLYYLRHDGEGEHQLAAQFDKRITALKQPTVEEE